MEVCFDLLLPNSVLDSNEVLEEELVEWGGDKYTQDPPKYKSSEGVVFTKFTMPDYLSNYLPEDIKLSNFSYLSLDPWSNDIYLWEEVINNQLDAATELALKNFLINTFSKVDSWIIVFSLNCDQIDDVSCLNPHQAIMQIENCLNWNNSRGFISIGKQYGED